MVLSVKRSGVAAITASLLLAGCSALPRSGPDDSLVERSAAAHVTSVSKTVGIDYVLVDINKDVLPYVSAYAPTDSLSGFRGGRGPAPNIPLGVGDVLEVSVFEAGAGGLFIPAEAGSRPGNYVTLPRQVVDSAGAITIPYAGRIKVAGRQPAAVQQEIEAALANRAIEPQVIINVVESRSTQVAILGDVNEPGKFEISPAGERILDVISRASGLSAPGVESYVTLERNNRKRTIRFDQLVKNPEENIYVSPGDTIYVERERRTYLVFGAAGLNGRIDFQESNLMLGDALGQAGGLLDSRADPGQVLLYRTVDRNLLQSMGVDVTRFPEGSIPTVYRANLRDPAAFFAVQKFPMQDRDILYVSNSDSVELTKFLDIVNSVSGTVRNVPDDIDTARSAVRNIVD